MNIQDLKTPIELEVQAHCPVTAPVTTATADGASAVHAETEAEVQRAFQRTKVPWSTRWLLGNTRGYGSSIKIEAKEADRLLEMKVEEVFDVLRKEKHARSRGRMRRIQAGLGLGLISLGLAKFAHIGFFLDHWLTIYVVLCISAVAVSPREKAAALAIARFDDVRAVGPLAEALELKDKYVASIVSRALIRLLPRLKASDASLLSPAQRACLNSVLKGRNPELMLAVIKAWEQVGDADAIDNVQDLAYGRMQGGAYPKVVAAARECLPFLRQSAERQQIGAQLLRPADGNLTPSDTLLRPVLPQVSTDPSDQLLRPTDAV